MPRTKTIRELFLEIGFDNKMAGWHDRYNSISKPEAVADHVVAKLALIMSEASEALEELRKGRRPDEQYVGQGGKPEGVPSELADIVIRTMDLAFMLDIDLPAVIHSKLEFNKTRGKKHGGKVL